MIRKERRCREDILVNVAPDGAMTGGCCIKSRGRINFRSCGTEQMSARLTDPAVRPLDAFRKRGLRDRCLSDGEGL